MKNILKIIVFGVIMSSSCSLLFSSGGSGGGGGGGRSSAASNCDSNDSSRKSNCEVRLFLKRAQHFNETEFAQHVSKCNPLSTNCSAPGSSQHCKYSLLEVAIHKGVRYSTLIYPLVQRILNMSSEAKQLALEQLSTYLQQTNSLLQQTNSFLQQTNYLRSMARAYQAIEHLNGGDYSIIFAYTGKDVVNEDKLREAIKKHSPTVRPTPAHSGGGGAGCQTVPAASRAGGGGGSASTVRKRAQLVLAGSANATSGSASGRSLRPDSALHKAIRGKNVKSLKRLLKSNADLNEENSAGLTPLLTLLSNGPIDTSVGKTQFQMLLNAGADVNSGHPDTRKTPLMYAAQYGDIDSMRMLLFYNAIINARNNHGNTAFHFAVRAVERLQENCLNVVDCLLLHKADVSSQNNQGESAFDLIQKTRNVNPIGFQYLNRFLQNPIQEQAVASNNQVFEDPVAQAMPALQQGFSSAAAAMTAAHAAPAGGDSSDDAAPSIQQAVASSSAFSWRDACSDDDDGIYSDDDDGIASFETAAAQAAAAQAARVEREAAAAGKNDAKKGALPKKRKR
jgi:hypothetical protein